MVVVVVVVDVDGVVFRANPGWWRRCPPRGRHGVRGGNVTEPEGGEVREISCSRDKLEFLIFVLRSSTSRPQWPSVPSPLRSHPVGGADAAVTRAALFPLENTLGRHRVHGPTYLPISDKLSLGPASSFLTVSSPGADVYVSSTVTKQRAANDGLL